MCRPKIWQAWNTASQVDRQDAVPIGVGGVEERAAGVHARAVDEDVDPAGLLRRDSASRFSIDSREVTLTSAVAGLAAELFKCLPRGPCSLPRSGRRRSRWAPAWTKPAHSAPPSTPAPPITTAVWPVKSEQLFEIVG